MLHQAKRSTSSGVRPSRSMTRAISHRCRQPALCSSAQSMVSRQAALPARLSVRGMAAHRADQQLLGDPPGPRQPGRSTDSGSLLLLLSLLPHVRWSCCLDVRPLSHRMRQGSLCGAMQTLWTWSAAAAMTAGPACLPPSQPCRAMSSQHTGKVCCIPPTPVCMQALPCCSLTLQSHTVHLSGLKAARLLGSTESMSVPGNDLPVHLD